MIKSRYQSFSLFLLLIIFLASLLRLYQLGDIPFGLTNDEAGIIYSGYSIFKTGKDPTGKFLPFSINLDNSFSPVYIYAIAPFVGFLGLNPFNGRLLFALSGVGSVLVLALLVRSLFKNDQIALLSALILTISPWHFHLSRAAFDANFALFFYLLGIYLFITQLQRGSLVFSLIAFLLAFYSYHATKIFFLFLIPVLFYVYLPQLLVRKKQILIFTIGCGLILVSFAYFMKFQAASSRTSVLLFNKEQIDKAAKMVDWERTKSTAPFFFRSIFNNKPLYFLRVIRENYLEVFSPHFLFLYGDTFGLPYVNPYFRGQMYIIELPLLFFGLLYFLRIKDSQLKKLWFMLLLIAPLPSTFNYDKTYIFRSVMLLPILSVIVAAGIYFFWTKLKEESSFRQNIIKGFFLFLYFFLFASYFFQYFYRYPVYGAEGWFRSSRELSEYLNKGKSKYKNIYLVEAGDMFIFQYAVFNKVAPNMVMEAWRSSYPKKINGITLLSGCLNEGLGNPNDFLSPETLYIVGDKYHRDIPPDETIDDFGEPLRTIWKIYKK
jgi:4-amino-4-deoxy-L-arabinose transferase-like glycosyltransferase